MLRRFREQIAPPAEVDVERHHELLADRIDRRIRDLREELLEVGVKQPRLEREHRERRVIAHRAHGFRAVCTIGLRIMSSSSLRVAEGELPLGERENVERLGGLLRASLGATAPRCAADCPSASGRTALRAAAPP